MISHMLMAEKYLLTDKYMKESGYRVDAKAKAFILAKTGRLIRGNGLIISKMAMVIKSG